MNRRRADAGEAGALAALQVLLVFRGKPIGPRGDGLAEAPAVLGQLEDRGIARGLRAGLRGGERDGGREGVAQEIAAPRLHRGDLLRIEEIFRRAREAPGGSGGIGHVGSTTSSLGTPRNISQA